MHKKKDPTIVVFDMDETLGHFVEFSIFCDIIENYNKKKLSFNEFSNILDLYPEFIRPHIFKILSFVKIKKKNGECDKVLIYTNNQGPKQWGEYIIKYFEHKLNYKLFDQIIGAYKIGSERNEMRRTGHEKSINDLINCTGICKTSNICFLDDQFHNKMKVSNVYYINLKPYVYVIPYDEMGERYYKYNRNKICDKNRFINSVVRNMNNSNYSEIGFEDQNNMNEMKTGKEILLHIQIFFKSFKRNKTKKKGKYKKKLKNITIKHKPKNHL